MGVSTTMTVECAPAAVLVGTSTTCTATVTGASADFVNGSVAFSSSSPGTFGGGGCIVVPAPGTASCELTYTPSAAGAHQITAAYSGSGIHEPSEDTAVVNVTAPSAGGPGPGGTAATPKKCKRKKKKARKGAASAKKRKCKKKKRK